MKSESTERETEGCQIELGVCLNFQYSRHVQTINVRNEEVRQSQGKGKR